MVLVDQSSKKSYSIITRTKVPDERGYAILVNIFEEKTSAKVIRIFAENVRVERARRRLTQEKLAEMADITPEYLARIENERYSPSLVVIVKIALALNVSVDTLIPIKK